VTVAVRRQDGRFCPPDIGYENKKPLSNKQQETVQNFVLGTQFNLSGPTWDNEIVLQPWVAQPVAMSSWPMEAYSDETTNKAWGSWRPAKYTFAFAMHFKSPHELFERSEQNAPSAPYWTGYLKTKPLTVEFVAVKPETR
jgi:hypothetical protein